MTGCLSSSVGQQLIPGMLSYDNGGKDRIISTFPAICTVLPGSLAGRWLLGTDQSANRKAAGLATAEVVVLLADFLGDGFFSNNQK